MTGEVVPHVDHRTYLQKGIVMGGRRGARFGRSGGTEMDVYSPTGECPLRRDVVGKSHRPEGDGRNDRCK